MPCKKKLHLETWLNDSNAIPVISEAHNWYTMKNNNKKGNVEQRNKSRNATFMPKTPDTTCRSVLSERNMAGVETVKSSSDILRNSVVETSKLRTSRRRAKNLYAQLPDTIASDPNNINRINRAGELFVKQNKCPPLNKSTRFFKQRLRSVEDVEKLVNSIMAALRLITVGAVAGPEILFSTNLNDLKEVLYGCLNGLISSSSIKDKVEQEWCSPLVTPDNSVSWIFCKFSSELTITEWFMIKSKYVEFNVEFFSFSFPTVNDFNHALNFAENQAAKNLNKFKNGRHIL